MNAMGIYGYGSKNKRTINRTLSSTSFHNVSLSEFFDCCDTPLVTCGVTGVIQMTSRGFLTLADSTSLQNSLSLTHLKDVVKREGTLEILQKIESMSALAAGLTVEVELLPTTTRGPGKAKIIISKLPACSVDTFVLGFLHVKRSSLRTRHVVEGDGRGNRDKISPSSLSVATYSITEHDKMLFYQMFHSNQLALCLCEKKDPFTILAVNDAMHNKFRDKVTLKLTVGSFLSDIIQFTQNLVLNRPISLRSNPANCQSSWMCETIVSMITGADNHSFLLFIFMDCTNVLVMVPSNSSSSSSLTLPSVPVAPTVQSALTPIPEHSHRANSLASPSSPKVAVANMFDKRHHSNRDLHVVVPTNESYSSKSSPKVSPGLRDHSGGSISPAIGSASPNSVASDAERDMYQKYARVLLDVSRSGLLIINSTGKILFVNKACLNLFGLEYDYVVGRSVFSFVVYEASSNISLSMKTFIAMGKNGKASYAQSRRRDGTYFPVEMVANSMPNGFVVSIFDVSELMQTQELLRLEKIRLRNHTLARLSPPLKGYAVASSVGNVVKRCTVVVIVIRLAGLYGVGSQLRSNEQINVLAELRDTLAPLAQQTQLFIQGYENGSFVILASPPAAVSEMLENSLKFLYDIAALDLASIIQKCLHGPTILIGRDSSSESLADTEAAATDPLLQFCVGVDKGVCSLFFAEGSPSLCGTVGDAASRAVLLSQTAAPNSILISEEFLTSSRASLEKRRASISTIQADSKIEFCEVKDQDVVCVDGSRAYFLECPKGAFGSGNSVSHETSSVGDNTSTGEPKARSGSLKKNDSSSSLNTTSTGSQQPVQVMMHDVSVPYPSAEPLKYGHSSRSRSTKNMNRSYRNSRLSVDMKNRMSSGSESEWLSNNPDQERFEFNPDSINSYAFDSLEYTDSQLIGAVSLMFINLNLDIPVDAYAFEHYVNAIAKRYRRNPYHNFQHAVDVAQHAYMLLQTVSYQANFTDVEKFALFFAALIHDVDHNGMNNDFLVKTDHDWAILHSDDSPLERHHLATAFECLHSRYKSVIAGLSRDQYTHFRKIVIEAVLGTDMKFHGTVVARMKKLGDECDLETILSNASDRIFLLGCLLHVADLGAILRPMESQRRWGERITQEFYHIGDTLSEDGKQVDAYANRQQKAQFSSDQYFFLGHISLPLLEALGVVIPDLETQIITAKDSVAKWSLHSQR